MNSIDDPRSRTEERLQSYARTTERALFVAISIHLVTVLAINPWPLLNLFLPRTMLGYTGRSHRGELAPLGTPGRPGPGFRLPRSTGPANLIHVDARATSFGPAPTQRPAAPNASGQPVPGIPQPNPDLHPRGTGPAVRIELDENWSVVAGSGGTSGVARSSRFQVLSVVRPEYPLAAIRAGRQGLVRLEVHVDTSGTVVDIRTDENTTSDREMETAAVQAMSQWVFKPYRERTGPVPFTLIVPFRYRLVD